MKIIQNEKQKDNLAKLLYDFCKIIFAIVVVGPIVQPEKFNLFLFLFGITVSLFFLIFAYKMDKRQIQ